MAECAGLCPPAVGGRPAGVKHSNKPIYGKGAFAADLRGISKNTIYMHIRNYRKACGPEDFLPPPTLHK